MIFSHQRFSHTMKNIKILPLIVLVLLLGFGTTHAQTSAQNKETARKILAAVDAGDFATFARYVSPSLIEHMPPPPGVAKTGSDFELAKILINGFHEGFPDSKTTILNIAVEGDLVIVHSVYTGTNKGSFMGMPATNKTVRMEQVDIMRFDARGIGVEHWSVMDQLTMLQQLGVIPTH